MEFNGIVHTTEFTVNANQHRHGMEENNLQTVREREKEENEEINIDLRF